MNLCDAPGVEEDAVDLPGKKGDMGRDRYFRPRICIVCIEWFPNTARNPIIHGVLHNHCDNWTVGRSGFRVKRARGRRSEVGDQKTDVKPQTSDLDLQLEEELFVQKNLH